MIRAVLFDRDGTLIADTPPNREPERVALMPGVVEALGLLRERDVRIGVVTNQPAIGEERATLADVDAIHERIECLGGPIDAWFVCPHRPDAGCGCRKPKPGLILEAARAFWTPVQCCAVIGDIGSDMSAARAAGAMGVLVPTPVTRPQEIREAPLCARNVLDAVRMVIATGISPQ